LKSQGRRIVGQPNPEALLGGYACWNNPLTLEPFFKIITLKPNEKIDSKLILK
jgi:hypothetical protein